MPDPTQPILHPLGDLAVGETVCLRSRVGAGMPQLVESRNATGVRLGAGAVLNPDTLVHRLIPETPLTKHAGEMYDELKWCLAMFKVAHRPAIGDLNRLEAFLSRISSETAQAASRADASQADVKGGA